ncbi:MAG: hypothetical protein ACM31C_11330 [Acidobacteriota bacterium]
MASWDELRAHLRATCTVIRDDPEAFAVSWTMTAGDGELVQGVGLAPMTVDGRPWLTMIAELFVESELPARLALLYQDRLAFGALVLREGFFVLRHGAPLAEVTHAELDWTLRTLAHEAARLRLNVRQLGQTSETFGNYAE